MPLTQQFGVQIMASVAAVWSTRKSRKRRSRNKVNNTFLNTKMTLCHTVDFWNDDFNFVCVCVFIHRFCQMLVILK